MKRMGNTGREMVESGAWVKVGRKHYLHGSGVEVRYDNNRWMWEVVGTGYLYSALWVARQAAEKEAAKRHTAPAGFKVGDRVVFNGGFRGTVTELYSAGMIVVRSARGSCCIPTCDAVVIHG